MIPIGGGTRAAHLVQGQRGRDNDFAGGDRRQWKGDVVFGKAGEIRNVGLVLNGEVVVTAVVDNLGGEYVGRPKLN